MLKKVTITLLGLVLLLSFCACSRPRLVTGEKLQVEIRGEGTKTLTLILTGPSNSLYTNEIKFTEDENAVLALKGSDSGEDSLKLRFTGVQPGIDGVMVTYYDGDVYAAANISVFSDESLKLSVLDTVLSGESTFEPAGELLPEGSEISRSDESCKLIRLTSADSPWIVEKYDEDFIKVEEYGYSEESQSYEFMVSGVSSGSGSVSVINSSDKQRLTLNFDVSAVVDGGNQYLSVTLVDSSSSVYDEMQSEDYISSAQAAMEFVRRFSPKVFVPASAKLSGCGAEDDFLDISLELDANTLEYLVFKEFSLEENLAEFKKAFPKAETDSFDTNGIKVTLFSIEDYSVCMWEKDGLLCELYIFDESDIISAGDVVEAFLSDAAL